MTVTESIPPRAAELVRELRLSPHPEGGQYREVFRSRRMVRTDDGRSERWAATAIHYLICAGERRGLHRVASDEVWSWHEGAPLELLMVDPAFEVAHRVVLGPVGDGRMPMRVVPAGIWQGVRPLGDYALAGCIVVPGFERSDLRLLVEEEASAATFRARHPDLASWL
jgi:hypothetical protein